MLTAMLLLLCTTPDQAALNEAWYDVQDGAMSLQAAVKRHPALARAERAEADLAARNEADERLDLDRLTDDINVDDEELMDGLFDDEELGLCR